MREIRTSGLMSGDRKRDAFGRTRASPRLYPISNFPLFLPKLSITLRRSYRP